MSYCNLVTSLNKQIIHVHSVCITVIVTVSWRDSFICYFLFNLPGVVLVSCCGCYCDADSPPRKPNVSLSIYGKGDYVSGRQLFSRHVAGRATLLAKKRWSLCLVLPFYHKMSELISVQGASSGTEAVAATRADVARMAVNSCCQHGLSLVFFCMKFFDRNCMKR